MNVSIVRMSAFDKRTPTASPETSAQLSGNSTSPTSSLENSMPRKRTREYMLMSDDEAWSCDEANARAAAKAKAEAKAEAKADAEAKAAAKAEDEAVAKAFLKAKGPKVVEKCRNRIMLRLLSWAAQRRLAQLKLN